MRKKQIFDKIKPTGCGAAPAMQAELARRCGRAEASKMLYTYVLKSKKDKKLYIGFTNNLRKRINDHYQGKVKATKNRRPLELIYYEAGKSKHKAIKREKYFKTGYGRRFLTNRI